MDDVQSIAVSLEELGWDSRLEDEFRVFRDKGWLPGRIAREEKELYLVYSEGGELRGKVSGAFMEKAQVPSHYPKVGDWVAMTARPEEGNATIHAVLSRKNALSRKEPYLQTAEQTLAVNLDSLFIVMGLEQDFNLRRLERFLAMAYESTVDPVLVLNKADLCPDPESLMSRAAEAVPGVPICVASAVENRGLEEIRRRLGRGKTAAFVGSSGVGKSSLVNRLLGSERAAVHDVMDEGRGRHTTSRRELMLLPGGGLVMDTPGLRGLELWGDEAGLDKVFAEIASLSSQCRFRDCLHENEPGCAVKAKLESGDLDQGRYSGYRKLVRESQHMEARRAEKERRQAKARARSRRSSSKGGSGRSWRVLGDEEE